MVDTTFQVVMTNKCNANCPFCISKQTPKICKNYRDFDYDRLEQAIQYAKALGITTCKITGKGDPLVDRDRLLTILEFVIDEFPIIELQTNGIGLDEGYLDSLQCEGVTIIALSCVQTNWDENKNIYGYDYPSLIELIPKIHDAGMSVRLSCCMVKGYVDSVEKVNKFIKFAKEHDVEQVSLIPVGYNGNGKQAKWAKVHQVDHAAFAEIEKKGTLLRKCEWGGEIYDYKDTNVYIANCLGSGSGYRYLIFMPDGHLRYSWVHRGAVIF